jgi:hypothetical protein
MTELAKVYTFVIAIAERKVKIVSICVGGKWEKRKWEERVLLNFPVLPNLFFCKSHFFPSSESSLQTGSVFCFAREWNSSSSRREREKGEQELVLVLESKFLNRLFVVELASFQACELLSVVNRFWCRKVGGGEGGGERLGCV